MGGLNCAKWFKDAWITLLLHEMTDDAPETNAGHTGKN